MLRGIAIAAIIVNILILLLFPLFSYKASYDNFLAAKSSYQYESEIRAISPAESKYFILAFLGLGIIAMIICYFVNLPIIWGSMLIVLPAVHIAFTEFLVKLANTNFYWYNFFSNPWFGYLFGVIKSENGLIVGIGATSLSMALSPGFLYLYALVIFSVWALLRKE